MLDKTVYKGEQSGNRCIFIIQGLSVDKDLVPGDHLFTVMVLVRLGIHRRSGERMISKNQNGSNCPDDIVFIFIPKAECLSYGQDQSNAHKKEKEYYISCCIGNGDQLSLIQIIINQPKGQQSGKDTLEDQKETSAESVSGIFVLPDDSDQGKKCAQSQSQ